VFKVFTVAAGLDSGAVSPHTTYYDSGEVTLNGRTIHNWDLKSHGTQTIANVLEKSLNTGSVFAEQQTGHGTFTEYVERFGFGDVSGIQLPGEVPGDITNLYGGRDINYATASFGQGISATPIQLISAFSAIANGGVLYEPNIVANQNPSIVRRVVKKESAEALSEILVSAVDKNVVAHIPQYKVAAKTGTANVPDLVYGGYSDDVINTYIGFAPATNPIFTVLVRLEKPQGAPLAGQTVVPAFKEMVEFLLNYYEVAPDRPTS
jgi:cell division protein FtsI/penicillin-binding protein 2